MARLATSLALLATAAAASSAFDYTVEVTTPNDFDQWFNTDDDVSLVASGDGLLYASSYELGTIEVFTDEGTHVRTIDPPSEDAWWPNQGLVLNAEGTNLYYGSYYCVRVIELDNDDISYTLAGDCYDNTDYRDGTGEEVGMGYLGDIAPIAIDEADMYIYFINDYCNVRRIRIETTEVTTIAFGKPDDVDYCSYTSDSPIGSEARVWDVYSIAVHGDSIYIADYETLRRIDVNFPHAVTTIAGDRNRNEDCGNSGNCGGRGLDARFGTYLGITVDNFGEWILVADYDNGLFYQCALGNVVDCAVIAGEWDQYEEIDGEGTNARFACLQYVTQGQGMSHDDVFVSDYCTGSIRKLAFNDLRNIENESPKFTIGVFVASGVAALLAGFAILNAAPVA